MKKTFYLLLLCVGVTFGGGAFADNTFSCGDGYIKVSRAKIDGIETWECQKLWCKDLETGQSMGSGNAAANGYRATSEPVELTDNKGNSILCFGDRKWCSGETVGVWNPEYGGYTRGGADSVTYKSYQKGGCFAWRLEKPDCEAGKIAKLQNGEWICMTQVESSGAGRASSMRRTGTIRRP